MLLIHRPEAAWGTLIGPIEASGPGLIEIGDGGEITGALLTVDQGRYSISLDSVLSKAKVSLADSSCLSLGISLMARSRGYDPG